MAEYGASGVGASGAHGRGVSALPVQVDLVEVGLRDGLQNQPVTLTTAQKLDLLDGLVRAGVREIQLTSFVHPERVPQLADAEALCVAALGDARHEGVSFSGLALNLRGVQRAAAAGLRRVDLSLSASDAHSRRNAGMSLAEAERQLLTTVAAAHDLGLSVRGGVQCAFGCGADRADQRYEDEVVRLAARIAEAGVRELALADSAGLADPAAVERLLLRVRAACGELPIVLHLHDTRGLGLANLYAALRLGVTRFDTSFGGLGGCPFIPGATGNVASEDVVNLLGAMGVATGVDLGGLCLVSETAADLLGADLPSAIFALWRRQPTGEEVVRV